MRLLRARLEGFRNVAEAELELAPGFTGLIGPNGQGKTNTLEALYMVAALRPLRHVTRRALIQEGRDQARIEVQVERSDTGLIHDLAVELRSTSRTLVKDDKNVDASSFIGTLVAVSFTPDDLTLGKGSPDARRKFLDRALLNIRPAYLSRALRYQKAVKDRNKLLSDEGPDDLLDAFDEIIAAEGAAISVLRAKYVDEVASVVQKHFERIAEPAPALGVRYASSLKDALDPASEERTRQQFAETLGARRNNDRRRRSTTVGPHLDDLVFTLDDSPVKERASQGQHRAIALALKLSELTHLADQLGEPPVLLLDDMSSELDPTRSAQLFAAVGQLEGQVVLTSTEDPKALADARLYDVDAGRLTKR